MQYAQNLAGKGADVIELTEGENDDDEMFWMILGEDEFAKADYWKWRHTSSGLEPRIWKIEADSTEQPVSRTMIYSDNVLDLLSISDPPCRFYLESRLASVRCIPY